MKLLLGLIGKTLELPAGALDKYIVDGEISAEGLSFIEEKQSEKFKNIKKDGYDEGHGRGKREVLTERDSAIAKKYKADDPKLIGDALIDHILEKRDAENKANPEDIKKSSIFKEAKAEWEKELAAEKAKVDETERSANERITRTALFVALPELLTENGYAVPEAGPRRERAMKSIVDDLMANGNYRIDGTRVDIIDKDGKQLKDEKSFAPITLADKIKDFAPAIFDPIAAGSNRQPAGGQQPDNPGAAGAGGKKFNFTKPESAQKAMDHLDSIKDADERTAYASQMGAWEKEGLN